LLLKFKDTVNQYAATGRRPLAACVFFDNLEKRILINLLAAKVIICAKMPEASSQKRTASYPDKGNKMNLTETIKAARGDKPVDLLLTNARVVNVLSGEIEQQSIAVSNGIIVGFGRYKAKEILDLKKRFVAPGFIDSHVHIESAMTCISEFARAVVVHGTTTVAADPHEIANVLGAEGIAYMLQSAEQQPINIYFTLPSCVPATDMETAGARLSAEDLAPFFDHERIVALAEMMNYPGVIFGDPDVLAKIRTAKRHRKPVDGHAPGLRGQALNAYVAAGVQSDHECTTAREAKEKLAAGMHIMIRQGSSAKNLPALLEAVNERTARRMMWCTDDRHPHDLITEGHIDSIVRQAIQSGLDPILAIQIATMNPAEYFRLDHLGAIAPGRQADLLVFSDLQQPIVEQVYCRGILTAENGKMVPHIQTPPPATIAPSMRVDLQKIDLTISAENKKIRAIELEADQLITHERIVQPAIDNGQAVSDPSRDLLKIAVVERHSGSGNIGKGFVKGFGLKHGALASSVAHDSHNIIIVGTSDADMQAALKTVVGMGGGLAAVSNQNVLARLALPLAGLMSSEPVAAVGEQLDALIKIAHEMGCTLPDPFMTLSFLALPVIPELKLTDKGLIDVNTFAVVPLFV
jgi:adenine deaminase